MNLRRLLYLVIVLCSINTTSKAQNNHGFELNCKFEGLPDGTTVYLKGQDQDTALVTTISKGDRFSFKGKLLLDGRFCFIHFDTLVTKSTYAIFIMNKTIHISGSLDNEDIIVKGSPGHLEYLNFLNISINGKRKADSISTVLSRIRNKKRLINTESPQHSSLELEMSALETKLFDIIDENIQSARTWIFNHPNSLYAPRLVSFFKSDLGENDSQRAYEILSSEAKRSFYGVELKTELINSKVNIKIVQNEPIQNFTITNLEGKAIRLLEVAAKSRYTLIDCWASWCTPCRAEIPELKRVYSRYKDKGFNILGISSDDKESNWRKAVTEDRTSWDHGIQKDKAISKLFDIRAIPTYILIDSDGKLISFDSSLSSISNFGGSLRGEGLEKKLEELFGSNK
jgi:thiol-disulfide isomerase/thioredoxin